MTKQSKEAYYAAARALDPDPNRHTGRTTRMILKTIYTAMYNPGQPIWITDHYNTLSNIEGNVVPKVRETIARLQLKGFEIKRKDNRYLLTFTNPLTEQNN